MVSRADQKGLQITEQSVRKMNVRGTKSNRERKGWNTDKVGEKLTYGAITNNQKKGYIENQI